MPEASVSRQSVVFCSTQVGQVVAGAEVGELPLRPSRGVTREAPVFRQGAEVEGVPDS
ncbi:hypothetical protein ACFW84_32720 [Streptomyces anulatus]|uniref:hypothetical protein n=1 Tax=Streptomyces anulatus TaxID=1892 RepID=UPI0036847A40